MLIRDRQKESHSLLMAASRCQVSITRSRYSMPGVYAVDPTVDPTVDARFPSLDARTIYR
uniref:Uncharacterized protein n=1 Tax=Picea sitchensis TaxID=3332 RepID=A0A6B9XQ87_PICSI|nr:hypothetical protein Q903MT_gene3711 [Picea sitchensis]